MFKKVFFCIFLGQKSSLFFAVLLFFICNVFAQGLDNLPDRLDKIERNQGNDSLGSFSTILCTGAYRTEFLSSAIVDGIRNPDDFLNLMHELWCNADAHNFIEQVERSKELQKRVKLPFVYQQFEDKRRIYRTRESLDKLFTRITYLGRPPYYFGIIVSKNGTWVKIYTTAEGGGDEYTFQLISGRWRITEFADGGAC